MVYVKELTTKYRGYKDTGMNLTPVFFFQVSTPTHHTIWWSKHNAEQSQWTSESVSLKLACLADCWSAPCFMQSCIVEKKSLSNKLMRQCCFLSSFRTPTVTGHTLVMKLWQTYVIFLSPSAFNSLWVNFCFFFHHICFSTLSLYYIHKFWCHHIWPMISLPTHC